MTGVVPEDEPGSRDRGTARVLAGWLALGAAPTFAAMALLTWASGGGAGVALCTSGWFPLDGMVPMYWLMAAFHLSPWLRLASDGSAGSRDGIVDEGSVP